MPQSTQHSSPFTDTPKHYVEETRKIAMRPSLSLDRSPIDEAEIAFAVEMANTARQVLDRKISERPSSSLKPDCSFVTETDLMIEDRLREIIAAKYPGHGVIGEERGWDRADANRVWIIDPIDGTAAFIAGMPVYGTLIALAVGGIPALGIIDIPAIDARWIGASGHGTTRNSERVQVRSCSTLDLAIMTNSNRDYMNETEEKALDALRQRTATRIYGGASLNYGLLAWGRTDLALDAGQKIYDFAPFRPVVEGAGGVISDWNGKPLTLESSGQVLASGDKRVHRQALKAICVPNEIDQVRYNAS